ncbi:MAG: chemotaxis protein CheW, partial [Marinobacter sp.]|nr:chemotaxis protein CheW [Marinobacter sp.]
IPRSSRSQRERRVLVVEQGDIFSGLVVDSVLGMQYFATDSFKDAPEGVPENVRPFVAGGYERNEEVWKVFSAVDLLEDERFLDVAQW